MTQEAPKGKDNLESLFEEAQQDSLDDLYVDAMLAQAAKNPKAKRVADPSARNAIDAAAKRMRELYTLPENWTRARGVALIDKATRTLVGNFSEWTHVSLPGTRRLVREHQPIPIDATEEVEGYLGEALEQRVRGRSWTEKRGLTADIWMDEMMVGAPAVKVNVCLHLGSIVRVELVASTQFSSQAGNLLLTLPAGCDIWAHLSQDCKSFLRKQVSL